MSVTPTDDNGLSSESLLDLPPVQVPGGAEAPSTASTETVKQQGSERNPELLPIQPATAPQSQPALATQQPAAVPDPVTAQPAMDDTTSVATSQTPQIADDVDLIEKEWVEKAKSIVAQTKSDPHAQNQELNKVKADYIKQRFNKELRTK